MDPFPLSRWLTPEVQSVGRVEMAAARASLVGPGPWVVALDGEWRFRLSADPDAIVDDDIVGPTDDWSSVEVPGSWALQGHGAPTYLNIRMPFALHAPDVPADNPTAVYRRRFRLPTGWRSRRTFVRIGSADALAWVWVNGSFVGMGKDSRLASTFEITDHVGKGDNEIAIVVPQWSDASWIEDQDQWWLPGLHRSVELLSEPPVRLADCALVPGLADDGTTGLLAIDVRVDGADPGRAVPLTVDVSVRVGRRTVGTGQQPVPTYPFDRPDRETAASYLWPGPRVLTTLEVPSVEPWTHETPVRYEATVTLRDGDTVIDQRSVQVGFRRVEVTGNQLLINGVAVVINGVNRHEIHPDRGRAITVDDIRADLLLMKRHHVNAVRTAHYPDAEEFYDLCDELGLYVVDEANIESHARWGSLVHDRRYLGALMERVSRMVVRDRSHPCVIAWSLGNESGDGAAHDAMAAWARRTDPSRPVHYEGGFTFDLHAASPASDIVCPMYASPAAIAAWAEDGRDTRRPLILCEYNHAMGQAGGLADYWALFGQHGLQGGFVWEWCDHALRRVDADGERVLAYGGDFGEAKHDGAFVCDGLVSADRVPHPLLAELAALTQPVDVEWAGAGFVSVTNRRWFTSLDDLRATWVVEVDGRPVGRGVLDLPPIAPQEQCRIAGPPLPGTTGGTVAITFTFRSRRATAWAARGSIEAVRQLLIEPETAEDRPRALARPGPRTRRAAAVDEGDRLQIGPVGIVPPALCLWRPPTDNDDPPGEWHHRESAADRWRGWGLDRIEASAVEHRREGTDHVSTTTYELAVGSVIHRQRRRVLDGAIEIVDDVTIPEVLDDLPRVGVRFELPAGFDTLEWFGFGPGDSYPDRRAATTLGRWRQDVREQAMPFIVPQEYGLHVDTRWFRIGDGTTTLEVTPTVPLAFSALPYRAEDLTAVTHAHQLTPDPSGATFVHLDAAHRGLGTAACGPDTADRWKIRGGTFRWTWRLSATTSRQSTSS